jgi:SIR2-like domain
MTTAIFLGAGASAAEGAPMQKDLFKIYFKSVANLPPLPPEGLVHSEIQMKSELSEFFRLIFNIDVQVKSEALETTTFPIFEEALGVLDLAELRRESLKNFDLEDVGSYGNRIRLIRQFLILAMAKAIAVSLGQIKDLHLTLVTKLRDLNLLPGTVFVSTNYDLLIDNALINARLDDETPGKWLDYGVDFSNFDLPTGLPQAWRYWHRPHPEAIKLFKLHGSLNWLYCSTCNSLTLTSGFKGVVALITNARDEVFKCLVCGSIMSPIIVPPTFYKDMSRVFLSLTWNRAEASLRQADHIIFCGYSFPDADIHLKYLLKRVQTNRPADKPLRFTVINNHPDKKPEQSKDEKERFTRFLGPSIKYTDASFEEFAGDPAAFYA